MYQCYSVFWQKLEVFFCEEAWNPAVRFAFFRLLSQFHSCLPSQFWSWPLSSCHCNWVSPFWSWLDSFSTSWLVLIRLGRNSYRNIYMIDAHMLVRFWVSFMLVTQYVWLYSIVSEDSCYLWNPSMQSWLHICFSTFSAMFPLVFIQGKNLFEEVQNLCY